jgi:predicted transcriptional regulator
MARARGRGDLEREILACLGARGEPMTPAEVLESLGTGLAYTTVMTTLSRMHDKRALVREPRGRAYAYAMPSDVGTAHASMTAFHMQKLLDAEDDRAGVLAQFVANLDDADGKLLQQLLRPEDPA